MPGKAPNLAPRLIAVMTAALLAACDGPNSVDPDPPLGIVLLIGDGMGQGAIDAGRLRAGSLAMETLPVRGQSLTSSTSHRVTDSGAAATALATGVRTYNGAIGVGPDSLEQRTVLDAAEARGMATGLVATSQITHATPAAFAAHVKSRADMNGIALQMERSGVDVLLGGGLRYFTAAGRPDGADLLARFRSRGCTAVATPGELAAAAASPCLVGLFADEALPAVGADRRPSLVEMSRAALPALMRDPDGFFLMVEGSQIDWAAEANDGPRTAAEVVDFDAAVAAVLAAVRNRPNTLVVVTADHETGGLALGAGSTAAAPVYVWATNTHTDAPVSVFSQGRGSDRLAGTYAIEQIGAVLLDLLR